MGQSFEARQSGVPEFVEEGTDGSETFQADGIAMPGAGTAGFDKAFADASEIITLELRSHRQSAAPMEGRAGLAEYDARTGRVTLTASVQMPHMLRTGIADTLGITEYTTKGHLKSILAKLRVADRTQAVIAAVQRGLIHY